MPIETNETQEEENEKLKRGSWEMIGSDLNYLGKVATLHIMIVSDAKAHAKHTI